MVLLLEILYWPFWIWCYTLGSNQYYQDPVLWVQRMLFLFKLLLGSYGLYLVTAMYAVHLFQSSLISREDAAILSVCHQNAGIERETKSVDCSGSVCGICGFILIS